MTPFSSVPEDERGRLEDTVGRSKGLTEASWASGLDSDLNFRDSGLGVCPDESDFDSSPRSSRTSSCAAS